MGEAREFVRPMKIRGKGGSHYLGVRGWSIETRQGSFHDVIAGGVNGEDI
jgi:hypothetical protein